jgi:nicotinamidase-related amidase
MRSQLLIIDPQNDFCDIPDAALPVAGAAADLQRVADFISRTASQLVGITVTLDSHPGVAVERTSFWQVDGLPVAPFTFITAEDVRAGTFSPINSAYTPRVLEMLDSLAAARGGLVVWPVHCVVGTPGHNIYSPLANRLQAWEVARQIPVRKVLKGEHPLTEHFGVFEADVPLQDAPGTQFNTELARVLTEGADVLLLAGQASSHCVASSYAQLARYLSQRTTRPQIIVLTDCMSPVGGFESQAEAFFASAKAEGCWLMTADEASDYLVRAVG